MRFFPFTGSLTKEGRQSDKTEKKRFDQERLSGARRFKDIVPPGLKVTPAKIRRNAGYRWCGIYIAAEKDHLLAESGRRRGHSTLPDSVMLRLFNGLPAHYPHGLAFPVIVDDKTIGYLLVERRIHHNAPNAMDLLMTHAGLIAKELENEVHKRLSERYAERLEQEEKRNKHIERHYSTIIDMAAHDLISPISAIRGYLEIIEKKPLDEEKPDIIKSYFNKISLGINDISAIVKQFEDVKSLSTEKQSIEPITANLNWIVQDITDLFQAKATNQNVNLSFTAPQKPVFVPADVTKLKRSIMNLVSNAIKFSKTSGFVKLELETRKSRAVLKVIDNGIGIRKEKQDEVFKPFIQDSPNTRKKDPTSVGLGLYIAAGFIHQMNGTLELKSKTNVGSCFTIKLPKIDG